MGTQEYCIVAFPNARMATQCQKAIQQAGIQAFMMPTPRELSASCGLSLRLPLEEWQRARETLDAAGIPAGERRFYQMSYDEHHRTVSPMEESIAPKAP